MRVRGAYLRTDESVCTACGSMSGSETGGRGEKMATSHRDDNATSPSSILRTLHSERRPAVLTAMTR